MTKEEYLKKIENVLAGLPQSDVNDILADYREHFEIGLSEGRSESDLIKSLGDPILLGKQTKADYRIKKAEKDFSAKNITRAVLATAGLGFFNLIFILGPFMGLVGIMMGLFAASIGITATGIAGFIGCLIALLAPDFVSQFATLGTYPIAGIFLFISMGCFGLLFLIGNGYLAKGFYTIIVKYLKMNVSIIKGEEKI